mgnify:CR=1 FL=1
MIDYHLSPFFLHGHSQENMVFVIIQEGGRMTVLVTGAAGFVGSHVALSLKSRGDGVVGLDNFNDYYPVALKRARASILQEAGM